MAENPNMRKQKIGSVVSYTIGFVLSLVFTLTAYYLVRAHVASGHMIYSHEFLIAAILTLAFAQCITQLFLFLHLGHESSPRWKLLIFLATFTLMLIIVLGSLWIMNHLNANMMPNMNNMQMYLTNQPG